MLLIVIILSVIQHHPHIFNTNVFPENVVAVFELWHESVNWKLNVFEWSVSDAYLTAICHVKLVRPVLL